jgi:hypothetical protein
MDTKEVFNEATSQAMAQAPLALLGALFTTPGRATSALKVAQLLGRNFPLVLLLVIGALVWPNAEKESGSVDEAESLPNQVTSAETYH